MGNSLNENIEGRYVRVQRDWFKTSLQEMASDQRERVVKALGGFGCGAETMGNAVFVEFVVDGEQTRVQGYDLEERFPTDADVDLAMIERRRRNVPWNENIRSCDFEFGASHEHDDMECARMIDAMSTDAPYDGLADALNREAEEQSLGRPLFPNEF